MKPIVDCPYFKAWVANTVADLSGMLEHPCGIESEGVLTFTETRMFHLSSPVAKLPSQALTLDSRLALANLLADFRNVH